MSTTWFNTEVEVDNSLLGFTTVTIRTGDKKLHDEIVAAIEAIRDRKLTNELI